MTSLKRKQNEEVITRYIPEGAAPSMLLDVGVGPKSEYLSLLEHYPDMRVVGLEPYVPLFDKLKHSFPGLLLPYAASSESGSVKFFVNESNLEASGIVPYERDYSEEAILDVPSVTLDWVDRHLGYPDKILLWMDIEGAEHKALAGARELFRSGRVRWINIEAREKWNQKPGGCVEGMLDSFFKDFGYVKYLIYNHIESTGHHDVIYIHKDEPVGESGLATSKRHHDKMGHDYTADFLEPEDSPPGSFFSSVTAACRGIWAR